MISQEVIEKENKYIMNTYSRFPVAFVKGQGVHLWDSEGKQYLDFVSGLGAINVGHSHPQVVKAVQEQVAKLVHVSNLFYILPQSELAEKLCSISFGDKCFFANSGAESNEAAIKLSRKYARTHRAPKNLRRPEISGEPDAIYPYEILTTLKGFHGRTLATLAATGQPEKQKYFLPMPEGFGYVPYNDLEAVESNISSKTCAIMVEVIQGEGGVNVASNDYLIGLRKICDKNDLLLIIDEVQTGLGRTGNLFAYEYSGIKPDIITLAKGLGSGFPIGVMIASGKLSDVFTQGDHATTFGGNPLACAAGLATLRVLEEENLVENCRDMGIYFSEKLEELKSENDSVEEVRGRGLLLGMELTKARARNITKRCLEKGLVINCIGDNVLRFLPPLIITKDEIDKGLGILKDAMRKELSN